MPGISQDQKRNGEEAVKPFSFNDYRAFLIRGRDLDEVIDYVVDQKGLAPSDQQPLSEQAGVTITAYADRSVFAAEEACEVEGKRCAVLFMPDHDARYLLATGEEVRNPYQSGQAHDYVKQWLKQLPSSLLRDRLEHVLWQLDLVESASYAVPLLEEVYRLVAAANGDADEELVDRVEEKLHDMRWAIIVPDGGAEDVKAVHYDGYAIMAHEDEWWHERIEDVWLRMLGAGSEADLSISQRQDYATWMAALDDAQSKYQTNISERQ